MTKNEYIASIMLEAADLLKEENGSVTKKFYFLIYEDEEEDYLSYINNKNYDGIIDECYPSIKDCILQRLKLFGTIKHNLFELKRSPNNYILRNTLYEITTNNKVHYNSREFYYEITTKNIIDAKKIKTYRTTEEFAKEVGLKVSDKKIKNKIKNICDDRKKSYKIAIKYLNQLENKIESSIIYDPKSYQYDGFFSPIGEYDYDGLINSYSVEIAEIKFPLNSNKEFKINEVKNIKKIIDIINKKIIKGYDLTLSIPNISYKYYPKDIHDGYDFIKLVEYVAEYIDYIVVILSDFKYVDNE